MVIGVIGGYMKALIIINPAAGKTKRRSPVETIRRTLRLHGYECDAAMTHGASDAESYARKRAESYQLLVCSGGDGTLSETVNGLIDVENRPPIIYLPAGTTNDFAKSLGLSKDLNRSLSDAFNGTKRKLDVGRMNGRCFIYVASFGFLSESSYKTPAALKHRIGRLAYILEGLREIPFTKSYKMKVYDGEKLISEGEYVYGSVSNSTLIGGLLHFGSGVVDLSDGLHEVLLVKKPKSLAKFAKILKHLGNMDTGVEGVELYHLSRVRFECEAEIQWSLDGERCPLSTEFEIENIPSAAEFFLPDKSSR